MKRWLLHIWMMGVLGMLAASCSQVIDDPVSDGDCKLEKEKVMIRFTIALDEPKAASRSWDGYDPEYDSDKGEVGTEEENSINPDKVQVLAYDLNGVLLGQLKDLTVERENDSSGKHVYDLIGGFEVDGNLIANNQLSFKLMVIANCDPITDMSNLENLAFQRSVTTDGSGIPMWGIATYSNVTVYSNQAEAMTHPLEGYIYMLRSMAKIEVTLDDDTKAAGYTLEGATLSKVMESGYVLPALKDANGAAMTLANLTATTELGIENVLHAVEVNSNNSNVKSDDFYGIVDAYVIYVPEYQTSGEDNVPVISLKLKDGDDNDVYKDKASEQLFSFKHGYYNDGIYTGKSMNIVRNHYYKYKVSIMNDFVLKVSVCPYGSYELQPEFGL